MKIQGEDNYGNPRQDYVNRIMGLDPVAFGDECKNKIWLSAYASNNPRSDYHWQADACYTVCVERWGDAGIYDNAWHRASGQ